MKTLIYKFVGTNREFREGLGLEKKLEVKSLSEAKDILLKTLTAPHTGLQVCGLCGGKGYYPVADGPDDTIDIECGACQGSGVVEVIPF